MFHYCKHQPVIWPSSSEPTTGARQWNLAIIFITADGWRVYPSNKDYFQCSKRFYLKHSEPLKKRRMTSVFLFVGFLSHYCWNSWVSSASQKTQEKSITHLHVSQNMHRKSTQINIFQHVHTCSQGRARHRRFHRLDRRRLYFVWTWQPFSCINYPITAEDGWRGLRVSSSAEAWISKPIWDLQTLKPPLIEKMT